MQQRAVHIYSDLHPCRISKISDAEGNHWLSPSSLQLIIPRLFVGSKEKL